MLHSKVRRNVEILIPTIGRPELAACLASIICQTSIPSQIHILDSSRDGIESQYQFRQLIELINIRTGVHVVRAERKGIGEARARLLDMCVAPKALMVDDDIIMESNVLESLDDLVHRGSRWDFAVPSMGITGNPFGWADFVGQEPKDRRWAADELKKGKPWPPTWQYAVYNDSFVVDIPYAETYCILVKKDRIQDYEEFAKSLYALKWDEPGEDILLMTHLGWGVLASYAQIWHILDPAQDRSWDTRTTVKRVDMAERMMERKEWTDVSKS